MDYEKFYAEVASWIHSANMMANKFGMTSNAFWQWVARSSGEMGNRYGNDKLVVNQMVMLVEWLHEIYNEQIERQGEA